MAQIQRVFAEPDQALLTLSPWKELDAPHSADLLRAGTPDMLNRGDVVDHDLGIVSFGALGIERALSNGRRVLCTLFRKGDLVDVRRTERIRQGALVALKRSSFLRLDESLTETWLTNNTDIAKTMLSQLREQFARARDHTTDLVSKTPVEKLASLLFEFRRWPETCPEDHRNNIVRIPISRSDIASYIGVKPETVSRVIKKLVREKLIIVHKQDRIYLADLPSMRRIANGGRPRQSTRQA